MPKIELSLKASYLPGWGLFEGLRELVQNARDAEVQDNAKMTIKHLYRMRDKRPIGAIIITNEGTTMPKEAFLIGHTTKSQRSDLIGKFGEGFKFGVLALLRLGLDIKIANGDETWIPLIERSDRFDAEVLKFDCRGGNKYENRFQVEILGVDFETWEKVANKFLFLNPPIEQSFVKVQEGKVLMAPEHKGNIYVKGMFVCHDENLFFGYDANCADIDRDRRMVSDQSQLTSKLLAAAVQSGKLADKVYEMMHEGSGEVNSLYWLVGEDGRETFVKKFQEQYGEDALPCDSEDEVIKLSHLGKRGVKVPYNLRSILQKKFGSIEDNIRKLSTGIKHRYTPSELTEDEHMKFERAADLLSGALAEAGLDTDLAVRIAVVDFGDSQLCGTYHSGDRSIQIARHQLKSTSLALRVLVHEAAHQNGNDGTKQHEEAIGKLTAALFKKFLGE